MNNHQIRIIETLVSSHKHHWEKANDGLRPQDQRDEFNTMSDTEMEAVEALAKAWGVAKIDWPGLYPSYFDAEGHCFYDLASWNMHRTDKEKVSA